MNKMMDDEKLIDLVRSKEILYNKTMTGYRLSDRKVAAWTEIARELGKTGDQCNKRWISLHERYSRELRKMDAPSGSGATTQVYWPLMDSLSFLKPFVKPRPTRCTFNVLEESSSSLPSPGSLILFPIEEEFLDVPAGDPVASTPQSSTKLPRKRHRTNDADDEFKEVCQMYKEVHKDRQNENKAVRAFGEMIIATISEMSDTKQTKAMQIITNTVMELKLEPDF
ncbi:PREDICTED: uncharacterized protein LOC108380809 [Rhagoletis zephyria]|uniref:uncharacterized protein LOC108375889 n=1 Tax=Rhagoletis zephyria TaxID=28612 RepID=UPI000811A43A|nr:PREDICTED: uncharacterized protein LOC108375889 [Rhagoletis zephyria]XP_017492700.1 PREDICTED: uncharacterized protein LOC108380809 [Rhagoletis zephyria]